MKAYFLTAFIGIFKLELTVCTKFLQIATICELFIKLISLAIRFNPSFFPQLIDFWARWDLHFDFRIAKTFSTGEYSGVYMGINT